MDYTEFQQEIEKLGDLDVPTPEQTTILVEGEDSIHLSVGVGYKLLGGELMAKNEVYGGEKILSSLELLKEREAVRGKDYILTCYWNKRGIVFVTLHTTHAFLSEEDVL